MKDIKLFESGRVRISIAWYDIWLGLYIDTEKKKLYICLLPTLLISIRYKKCAETNDNKMQEPHK